jgi:hypothetical protein
MNKPSFATDDSNAKPFVEIIGGKRDGSLIGITDGETNLKEKPDLKYFLDQLKPKLKPREIAVIGNDVERALREDREPTEPMAAAVYREVIRSPSKPATSLEVSDGHFQPVFGQDTANNRVAYIFGPAGAGKSTAAKLLVDSWKQKHKKNTVYIFSRFSADSDDSLKIKNADYFSEKDMLEHIAEKGAAIKCDNLETPCLVLADDYDSFSPKAYAACAESIRDFLENGRKFGVSLIITSHLAVDKARPLLRTVWNEAHLIGLFPAATQGRAGKYALDAYVGLDKEQINKLLKLRSRCVWIRKPFPQAIASQHEIYLL